MGPCGRICVLDQYECQHRMHSQAMCHVFGIPAYTTPRKTLHYEIPGSSWEVVSTHIFMINGKTHLCILDYHSKFPIVKKVNSLSADDLVQKAKLIFAEYGLPKKIVSDVVINFMVETFKTFYRKKNIQQTTTLSYHHQNDGQVEACIKFVKCTIKVLWH